MEMRSNAFGRSEPLKKKAIRAVIWQMTYNSKLKSICSINHKIVFLKVTVYLWGVSNEKALAS